METLLQNYDEAVSAIFAGRPLLAGAFASVDRSIAFVLCAPAFRAPDRLRENVALVFSRGVAKFVGDTVHELLHLLKFVGDFARDIRRVITKLPIARRQLSCGNPRDLGKALRFFDAKLKLSREFPSSPGPASIALCEAAPSVAAVFTVFQTECDHFSAFFHVLWFSDRRTLSYTRSLGGKRHGDFWPKGPVILEVSFQDAPLRVRKSAPAVLLGVRALRTSTAEIRTYLSTAGFLQLVRLRNPARITAFCLTL